MMSARLILARHGNTFRPEDKPVWVGARSDLPLVEKGRVQAEEIGAALQKAAIAPDILLTGPLQRTRQTAIIVAAALQMPLAKIHIDTRLTEIDYGRWEGKSTEEIMAMGDSAELTAWNKTSTFPTSPGWKPKEAQILADTAALLAEAKSGISLIITSNGILRFFARAAVNAGDFIDRKVATGNVCVIDRETNDTWRIAHWNQPASLIFA